MLNKSDKLIRLNLNSPHVCDFIYQREDGTLYAQRRNHGEWYQEIVSENDQWIFGNIIETHETTTTKASE